MLAHLLDFFFPRISLTGQEGKIVTIAELEALNDLKPALATTADLRSSGLKYLDQIAAAADYWASPLLIKAIHRFKYQRVADLETVLAHLMSQAQFMAPQPSSTALCAVPLHWTRKFARGFNQAELIAKSIAKHQDIKLLPLLKRRRATGFQSHRQRRDRLQALQDVFAWCGGCQIPKKVILVDDIATTGATLDACAKVLKQQGVEQVEAWVVAYSVNQYISESVNQQRKRN